MALADRIQQPPGRSVHGYPCSVGQLLATLEGDELAAFKTMLGNDEQRGWPAAAIYKAVTDEGHYVGAQSINHHRGKRCRCFK